MNKDKLKAKGRKRRHVRIRSKVSGTKERPRLAVYKSNVAVYAQLIDDESGVTLISSSTKGKKGKTLMEKSKEAGRDLAERSLEKKIEKVVFDRGGFIYTGMIKAFAESARDAGLKF